MDHLFGQFWKLGFFPTRECQFFAHGGQLRIFIDCEHVDSVPTWKIQTLLHDPLKPHFDAQFPFYALVRDSIGVPEIP